MSLLVKSLGDNDCSISLSEIDGGLLLSCTSVH